MGADNSTNRPSVRSLLTDRLGWLGVRSGQILLMIALASAVVFALVQLKLVVIPVLIALILAAAISPVVNWLRKHNVSSILATWITLIAGVLVFGGIVTLIALAVRNQWDSLSKAASDGINQLQDFLAHGPIPIDQHQIDSARKAIVDFVTSKQFGTGAITGVSAAAQVVTGAVLTIVILFFFLKDGDRIWAFFLRPFTGERLERGRRVGHTTVKALGGYVRGTAIVALVDGVFVGIGLAIVQVPLALPLAVIVFLTAFIPLIGATLAGVLAALVALVTNGPVGAVVVVLIVIAVNQLEGNLLQPIVMARSLKLHPLVILLALTAGTILGGVIGAVLAVPIAAAAWAIMKVWNKPPDAVSGEQAAPAAAT